MDVQEILLSNNSDILYIKWRMNMKDLGELFSQAKDKKIYKDILEFKELINKIKEIDNGLELDWDTGAGEDWAQFVKKGVAIVCMLHTKIGIAFIRRDLIDSKTLELLQPLFIVDFLIMNRRNGVLI